MRPSPRKLAWPFLPTTMWSWTTTPSGLPALTICFVISISAFEGVGSPEGWLCTSTMAVADSSSGPLHHLAHIDRGVIDGARLLHLVGDDLVALVEEEDAELLLVLEA